MIDFRNICKSFSGKDILRDVTLRINPGERVGVVGPNGAGKSTLFSILIGELSPDSGSIAIPKNHRIGLMRQHIDHRELSRPLLDFTADAIPELKTAAEELKKIESDMAADLIPDADLDRVLQTRRIADHDRTSGGIQIGCGSCSSSQQSRFCRKGFQASSFKFFRRLANARGIGKGPDLPSGHTAAG